MAKYVIFHGSTIIHPGVYTWVDYSQVENILAGLRGIVAVLGDADEGEPGVVVTFSRSRDMIDYYKSGSLADAAQALFNPSPEIAVGKPTKVLAVRTNSGGQASVVFKQGETDAITVKSRRWGNYGNTIQVKIENGSASGSKRITCSSYDMSETSPDIEAKAFSIQRLGATDVVMTIDSTGLTAVSGENVELNLSFSVYPTIQALVNEIKRHEGYSATLLTGTEIKSTELDHVTNVDICSSPYTVRYLAKGIVDWLNNQSVLCEGVVNNYLVPDNATKTLSGGSVGITTQSSFSEALEAIKGLNVDFVVPLFDRDIPGGMTFDQMINTLKAHITEVNDIKATGERQAFVGMYGTVSDLKAQAINLNSPYIALIGQRVKGTNARAETAVMPAWYTACLIAGLKAGTPVGEPLTFKRLNIADLVDEFSADTINDLLLNGILMVERVPGAGFRIVKDLTTYLSTDNDILCSNSAMECIIYIKKGLRENLSSMVGSKGLPRNLRAIKNKVLGYFTLLASGVDAILTSTKDSAGNIQPPYRNVEVTMDGNVVTVRAELTIVPGIDYILNEVIPTKARA